MENEPTYIQQAENFLENWANEIPAAEALTWLTLFHMRNKARLNNGKQWPEWFEVSNGTLADAMHKDSRNLYKLKQKLRDKGLLDYRQEKKGKPTQYKILLPGAGSVKPTVTVENTHNPRKTNGMGSVKPTVRKYATLEPGDVAAQGLADPLRGEENKRVRERKKKAVAFSPPTLEEVREYVQEKGLDIDPQRFIDYYEAGDWHDRYGKPVKNWKQRAQSWNRSNGKQAADSSPAPPTREEREAKEAALAAEQAERVQREIAERRKQQNAG